MYHIKIMKKIKILTVLQYLKIANSHSFGSGIEGALLKISIESTLPCVVLVDLYQFSLQQVRVVSV